MLKRNFYTFKYRDFYAISVFSIIYGIILQPNMTLIDGMYKIMTSTNVLITDYMEIAGIGASFVNSGLLLLLMVILLQKTKSRITGGVVAGMSIVFGFSFFGKNVLNSIPLIIGVYLYSRFIGSHLSNFMHILCFATGISPAISFIMFGIRGYYLLTVPIAFLVGIFIGFIIIPLSTSMLTFHHGFSLYNVGFVLGIIGLILAGVLRMFGVDIRNASYIYEGDDMYSLIFLMLLAFILLVYGFAVNGSLKGYDKILNSSGRLVSDYVIETNKALVSLNMAFLLIICIVFVKVCGGIINGPVLGGIFTVMGFGAFGNHPRNVTPIMLGVFLASLINKYDITSTEVMIIALFATNLSPIAGYYGIIMGIVAGFLHKAVATNVGFLHGGMNLYNNGFAGGVVAAFLVPIIDSIKERFLDD